MAATASPAPSHVSPTPTPPPPPTPRPLRLRVRKAEAGYIGDIAAGTKLYEVTQTQYLGGSAHGWSLGWDTVEPEGELWIGLSPTGRQPPAGQFLVTHYACLEQCEVLDGVNCWGDVAALRGAGVSRAQAAARDAGKKTRLDATRRTYAWRFRAGSVYALAAPVAIAAFCGPWASTTLATANTADMPAEMAAQAVLSLVPTKLSKRQRAAASSPPPRSPSPAQLLRLGPYLLADGEIFEGLDPVVIASVQRPAKDPAPVLVPMYPWETTMHFYGSAVAVGPNDLRLYCELSVKARHSRTIWIPH